ncbi:MAG: hypothetical protein ACRDSL_11245 [Pseudonocardiaceae bacterium]
MKLRNLTPHPLTIITDAGSVHLMPEPGIRPRVDEARTVTEPVFVEEMAVPTVRVVGGGAVDLPEPVPGTLFVVSRVIAETCPGRTDLLVPYDLVRDESGRVVACRCLARFAIAGDRRR